MINFWVFLEALLGGEPVVSHRWSSLLYNVHGGRLPLHALTLAPILVLVVVAAALTCIRLWE
jgi:hypothetical protein